MVRATLAVGFAVFILGLAEIAGAQPSSPAAATAATPAENAASSPAPKRIPRKQTAKFKRVERIKPAPKKEEAEEKKEEEESSEINPYEQPLQYAYDDFVERALHGDEYWKKVKVAGYIAQSWTYNFNRPSDGLNSFRVYDRFHDEYTFNTFQLSAYADATTESRVGFGIKGNMGRDTLVFTPFDEPTADHVDLFEAYISYLLTDDLLIKAGKMSTLVGFEVADEKDNYNISRGLLWSLLEPVTHTGVRLVYTDPEKFYDLTFGINRGWDTFRHDNNDGTSFEARVGINQTDKLSYALTFLTGPESADNTSDFRSLIDVVATYKATDKLTYGINYDLRFDENATPSGGRADSHGLAFYTKYDMNDKVTLAARLEAVRDRGAAATGTRQTLGDATLTAQYKFQKNLFGRLEFRHDRSTDSVFTDHDDTRKSQNTIAASVLYTF